MSIHRRLYRRGFPEMRCVHRRGLYSGSCNFLLRHGLHTRVAVLQHGVRRIAVMRQLQPALVRRDQSGHLGVFARQRQKLRHVFHDVFTRQQKVQFGQALHIALELSAHKRLHREDAFS